MQQRESDKERFIKAARELECNESPEAFDATLKRLAKAKPMTNEEVKKSAKKRKTPQ
jgi:hypothetical protein